MSPARRAAGVAVALAFTGMLVALSRLPYAAEPSEQAELRLAWRHKSERVEECRRLSAEELARRPAHMRRETECERRLRPYRLVVVVDGRPRVRDSVYAGGARSDRPLSVFHRLWLEPGPRAVRVVFEPYRGPGLAFAVDTVLSMASRRTVLITIDEERGRFSVRGGAVPP